MSGWRVWLKAPAGLVSSIETALEGHLEALSLFEVDSARSLWLIEGYSAEKPDLTLLQPLLTAIGAPALTLEALPNWDWVKENQKNFPPIRIGRFYIYGSHIETPLPVACLPLKIDAATAFGTGEHPTTQGCLLALEWIHKQQPSLSKMLDVGCGTGVLAMGAKRLWPMLKAIGGDLHCPSVTVARQNAKDNAFRGLTYVTAGGTQHRLIQHQAPYPLITANILARPLVQLAPAFKAALAPRGWLVLSGLLRWQEQQVLHACRQQGLTLMHRIRRDNWATLILRAT